jgi:hypothetical protein
MKKTDPIRDGGHEKNGNREVACPQTATKKRYSTPSLDCYGDLRTITQAPSPGTFESGRGPGYRGV